MMSNPVHGEPAPKSRVRKRECPVYGMILLNIIAPFNFRLNKDNDDKRIVD